MEANQKRNTLALVCHRSGSRSANYFGFARLPSPAKAWKTF
jgi:hypothetical protein